MKSINIIIIIIIIIGHFRIEKSTGTECVRLI